MGLRPALFAALFTVAALAAVAADVGAVAAATATAAKRAAPPALSKGTRPEPKPGRLLDLDWKELLPENERATFTAVAPQPVHDYRGEGGPAAVQTPDFNVNKSLDGATVRLPGFIVPLDAANNGGTTEFLLVPYFGSCIHVPPPPPNQIVYVHTSSRAIESIYDAYWITGKLRIQTKATRLGAAAYELVADKIEVYKY